MIFSMLSTDYHYAEDIRCG